MACAGTARQPNDATTDQLLLVEEGVERLARIIGCLRLACLVRGKVPDHFRLVERALIARVLGRDPRRDVGAALPQRGGVEEAAVSAGVQVGAALHAGLVRSGLLETEALVAAGVALEDLRAESARRAAAGCPFQPARPRLGTRALGPLVVPVSGVGRIANAVLQALGL